ncbi:DNA polymerase III subunit delta [Aquipuribacter nitratireducens]|uniref:DNA-directed DNA polymerase n=1 Tax=Aquipuribacter nitratireducens TaxID=650104 RepID=A0ABW0GJL2_9MICO
MPPARRARGRAPAPTGPGPFDVEPAPVVVLAGSEQALADAAWRRLLGLVREAHPDVERHEITPQSWAPGAVDAAAAPSLFGGHRLVVLHGLEQAAGPYTDEVTAVATALASTPDPDLVLVARHAGGNGGKAVLAALDAVPGAVRVTCAPVPGERDRAALVVARLRAAGRRADPDAVDLLVESVGGDLAELLAVTGQLAETVPTGAVDVDAVRALVGGRREARGFDIADACVAGRAGQALSLLRHALAQRVEPVLVVGALASKLRAMARVAGAGRGPAAALARDLQMAPWQVDRARRDLAGWSPEGLRAALVAVADADAAVKGEVPGVAAAYALERAVVAVTDARERPTDRTRVS